MDDITLLAVTTFVCAFLIALFLSGMEESKTKTFKLFFTILAFISASAGMMSAMAVLGFLVGQHI